MKRIAVVLMMLAVASLAQAALYLTIDGQDVTSFTATVGQTYTIGLNSTDLSVLPDPSARTGDGTYGCMTIVSHDNWGPLGENFGYMSNPVLNANMGSGAISVQYASPYTHVVDTGWNYANPVPAAAGLWAEWTYTPVTAAVGKIEILQWDTNWASTFYDTVEVTNIVPEPATIALLGLGAVTLFRRK